MFGMSMQEMREARRAVRDHIVHTLRTELDDVQFTEIRMKIIEGGPAADHGVLEVRAIYEDNGTSATADLLEDRLRNVRRRLNVELYEMGFLPHVWLRDISKSDWDKDSELRAEWDRDLEFV